MGAGGEWRASDGRRPCHGGRGRMARSYRTLPRPPCTASRKKCVDVLSSEYTYRSGDYGLTGRVLNFKLT